MVATLLRSDFAIRKVHPHIGAEVSGVDLRRSLDDATFERIREAFIEHSVLVFRDQNIDDGQQVAFSQRFGELERTTFSVASRNPYVYELSNIDEHGHVLKVDADKRVFLLVNARWHTDSSFRPIPAMASALSGREVPRTAGDTQFASMRVGWETLPEEMRRRIEGLRGVHSYAYSIGLFGRHEQAGVKTSEIDELPPAVHPLVRTIPESGRRSLYVSGHIRDIVGLPEAEGRRLAEELVAWCTRPEFVYTHKWRQHDLVMWDNRCALHRATVIPTNERRIMHRTTIAGIGPVS